MRILRSIFIFTLGVFAACQTPAPDASKPDIRTPQLFEAWQADGNAQKVDAFRAFLQLQGVGNVVPLHQLLRTASFWNAPDCRLTPLPFDVPPLESWGNLVPTLKLVVELRRRGLLPESEVVSAYRNPAMNTCAGGAAGSAHLAAGAMDFSPNNLAAARAAITGLCAFWKTEGAAWNMGLGLYEGGRIHVDTKRYRTWGDSYGGDSAVCLK
jgi:Peptidase M15